MSAFANRKLPKVGEPAPAFSLPDQDGKARSLSDFGAKWLVLYFFPRADTPG
jgi:peroxiredoxin Q/BCP